MVIAPLLYPKAAMSAVAALRGAFWTLENLSADVHLGRDSDALLALICRRLFVVANFWGFLVKDFRSAGREARLVITPGHTMNLFSDLPLEFPPSPPKQT